MSLKVAVFAATALTAFGVVLNHSSAQQQTGETMPVTVENFIRAESDLYFSAVALKEDRFGKLGHNRDVSMQLISEDHYTPPAMYAPGKRVVIKEEIGTRYVLVGVRTLDLTGWLWTGLIERISQDQRSWV